MRILTAVLAALIVAVVAGCSAPADDDAGGSVQLNLPDGRSVTIPHTPQRIVTLGGQWTDVLLSFGRKPVGYYDAIQTTAHQLPPWYGTELADSTPLDPNGDIVAAVATLKPDLIVAPGFASMSGVFDKLTELAPTIDKISGAQVDPWPDMVTLMGTILHQPDKAKEIIAGVDGKIGAIANEYPGLKGKTYSFAYMYGSDQISVLGDPNDGAGKLFASLGLTMAPRLIQQSRTSGQPRVQISAENIPWLNSDLLVMATQTDDLRTRLESLPGYRNLASVKTGAVAMLNQMQITGLNEPAPKATVYVLDQLRPALARAAGQ
ncbi:ABC transporter substrate-binding protein [Gordonia sp. DT30]|uniref:ABC transporter substrate-binding protein n=1 Tax=unclassified Gordonia (in: high G+C Gram-positive bacteria) TaxID=2657482 RepID=UPI003CEA3192